MRRKVRNWAALLLALVLVWGMMPAAYAAGYSINIEAQEGAILPYWVFERAALKALYLVVMGAPSNHSLDPSSRRFPYEVRVK